jgi:hypothetical protein
MVESRLSVFGCRSTLIAVRLCGRVGHLSGDNVREIDRWLEDEQEANRNLERM